MGWGSHSRDDTRRMGQAVTPQIRGLKTTDMYFFLTVLAAESPKIKVSAELVSFEASLLDLKLVPHPACIFTGFSSVCTQPWCLCVCPDFLFL